MEGQSSKQTGNGTQSPRSYRATGSGPLSSSQLQRASTVIDLDALSTGVRQDFFLLQPQDASFQQLLISSASTTALTGRLTFKLVEAVDGRTVDLSESFSLTQLPQSPRSFAANRAWSQRGAVYLAVTGTQQSVKLNAVVEFMTSEVL